MKQASDRQDLWQATRQWKSEGKTIALVPTMGNLHEGHIALVRRAREQADRVITSIYVNPTQFGADEDLDRYPRTLDADFAALEGVGCDLAFTPGVDSIYPFGLDSAFMLSAPSELATILEGQFRPGHFDGVVTVVARLFNLVQPDVAIFGEKDFQQLMIIRRMVEDMGYDIRIDALATVRDEKGLALSSRNRYLDPEQVNAARNLFRVLQSTANQVGRGGADYQQLEKEATEQLVAEGLRADYVSIRREADLGIPLAADRALRILAAVWCGETRLIDNLNVINTCNHER